MQGKKFAGVTGVRQRFLTLLTVKFAGKPRRGTPSADGRQKGRGHKKELVVC